ncbi:MAG: hypothetical protein WD739_09465 [Actinomycetota bacterium]
MRSATFEVGSRGGHSDPTGSTAVPPSKLKDEELEAAKRVDHDSRRGALNKALGSIRAAADRIGEARVPLENTFGGLVDQNDWIKPGAQIPKRAFEEALDRQAQRERRHA